MFDYQYDITTPLPFLKEVSEHYANVYFFEDASPTDILLYAERELSQIPSIATYINQIDADTGESEMTYVFGWECTNDVDLMAGWFQLLQRLGGDVHRPNRKGMNALDVARARLRRMGYSETQTDQFVQSHLQH